MRTDPDAIGAYLMILAAGFMCVWGAWCLHRDRRRP
jgi:hypothetical protein